VGAGPGDPGLITVKGLECVKNADVIIYDYLANDRLLDLRRPDAELIYVGKESGSHTLPQHEISALVVQKAKEGRMVVRLKGGDPFVFGRGGEEAEELWEYGVPFEVVPGVSAAIAVPTYAGIPLTHRECNASVTFVTGHEDPTKSESKLDWSKLAPGVGTLVIFMGMKNLPQIVENLVSNGRKPDTPVAVIQWGTRTDQKVVTGTLTDIGVIVEQAGLGSPALIVVGDVVRYRKKLNWYESKPLFGKRIVVTGSRDQSESLVEDFTDLGATVLSFPTIDITPPTDWAGLDQAIRNLGQYSCILFRNIKVVRFFIERLLENGKDTRSIGDIRIFASGRKVASALAHYGLRADNASVEFTGEGLAAALGELNSVGKRVLLPVAKEGSELLRDSLQGELAASLDVVTAYESAKSAADTNRVVKLLEQKKIAVITFTSAAAVHAFFELMGKARGEALLAGVSIACIGPVTAKAVDEYTLETEIMPLEYTLPGLVRAVAGNFSNETMI
jgi:uroporphyrinogen III methyltransferase / synthase